MMYIVPIVKANNKNLIKVLNNRENHDKVMKVFGL